MGSDRAVQRDESHGRRTRPSAWRSARARGRCVSDLLRGRRRRSRTCPRPARPWPAAGKRLIRSHSAAELTAIATRGDRVLAALTAAERDALARGYLRFRIDRPADVFVAAAAGSCPFWVADLGFEPAGLDVPRRRDATGTSTAKSSGRAGSAWASTASTARPPAHYAVFVRSRDGGPGLGLERRRGRLAGRDRRRRGEPDGGASRPVVDLPDALAGRPCCGPRDDRRHSTLARRGPGLEDARRLGPRARPGGRRLRRRPGARTRLVVADLARGRRGRSSGSARRAAGRSARSRGRSETIAMPRGAERPGRPPPHASASTASNPATAYEYSLGDGTPAGCRPGRPSGRRPRRGDVSLLYMGDPQCGLEGWGKLLAAAHAPPARRRGPPDRRRPRRPGQRADELGPLLPPGLGRLRATAADALRRQPRIPRPRPLALPLVLRAAGERPRRGRAGPRLQLRGRRRLRRRARQHARRLRPGAGPTSRPTGSTAGSSRTRRPVEARDVPPPGLRLAPVAARARRSRDAWVPVFDRHHVDLVLQGHDHAYLRTYPMRGGRRVGSPARGDGLRRLGLGRQVLRPRPARLHRGRVHGRLDLSDDRHAARARTGWFTGRSTPRGGSGTGSRSRSPRAATGRGPRGVAGPRSSP